VRVDDTQAVVDTWQCQHKDLPIINVCMCIAQLTFYVHL